MAESKLRTYVYKCKCGYTLNVFIDCGTPQENVKCRKCSLMLKREDH